MVKPIEPLVVLVPLSNLLPSEYKAVPEISIFAFFDLQNELSSLYENYV